MEDTVRLGRIGGIPIGVNWSVLVIFALIALGVFGGRLPETVPGYPPAVYVLAGAAVPQGSASSRSMQGGVAIAVAGGQSFGVAYLLDGAMHNNPYDNLNLPLPFPDAMQEFRVETSSTTANNGMHSGASVNVVTKSGTNLFHGDLFEFFRDHRFNATNPINRIDPLTGEREGDGLNRNQFGGTLGGPVQTDRIFFFGAYQGTKIHQVPASFISWVPTAAMLAGEVQLTADNGLPPQQVATYLRQRPPGSASVVQYANQWRAAHVQFRPDFVFLQVANKCFLGSCCHQPPAGPFLIL